VFVVTRERFEVFVVEAIDSIPEHFASQVENVAIIVEDDAEDRNLLGLYEGVPLTRRWESRSGSFPDRITLFQDAICRECATEQEVREQIYATLVHELGHYFGIDDDRLDELGW
jgi:predicted Zn-dependent protease with MMP-like domain